MRQIFIYLLICLFIIAVFLPLYIMLKISLSPADEIFIAHPPYLLRHISLQHFINMFRSGDAFYLPLRKSILTALCTTFLSLLISIPSAYAISKFSYKVRYLIIILLFITRMLPEVSIALPISVNFIKLGLFDTILGLSLSHLIKVLPVAVFILIGTFSTFPPEIERQAMIDGYSKFGVLFKVVMPICSGGICVAGVFSFILSWDEFIYASYLTLANPTMPIRMYYYVVRGDIFYSATYAIIITIPVLAVSMFLQKYLRPEYISGGLKG